MELAKRSAKRWQLRYLLCCIILPLLIVPAKSAFGSEGQKKNEITGYLGIFGYPDIQPVVLVSPQSIRPSFGIGFERKLSNHFSFAVSCNYAIPSEWCDNLSNSSRASDQFYDELGDSGDFTEILEKRSVLIFDIGFYGYLKSGDRGEFFLYLGTGLMRVQERYRMIDNRSPLDENTSLSDETATIMDLGLGYKYRLDEHYSVRVEWRGHNFLMTAFGDDAMYNSFLLGLSYRF